MVALPHERPVLRVWRVAFGRLVNDGIEVRGGGVARAELRLALPPIGGTLHKIKAISKIADDRAALDGLAQVLLLKIAVALLVVRVGIASEQQVLLPRPEVVADAVDDMDVLPVVGDRPRRRGDRAGIRLRAAHGLAGLAIWPPHGGHDFEAARRPWRAR